MSNYESSADNLKEAIITFIATSTASKKEIQKHIKLSHQKDVWTKKEIKRALKQLVSEKKLCKDSNHYFIPDPSASSGSSEEESGSDESVEKQLYVPIAQRMKKQSFNDELISEKIVGSKKEFSKPHQVDFDEEIRRLETELAADSDIDEDAASSSDISYQDGDKNVQNSAHTSAKDDESVSSNLQSNEGMICLSKSANERIEPLPASAMPQIARKTISGQDKKLSKKRKHHKEEHTVNKGLKSAVDDLLSNYKPRSEVEQTPWYCRICQHQSNDEADFLDHRASELHKMATKEHQRKTYCRICRKQMTSVIQFQEHLNSRPHRELLASKRSQQQGRGKGGAGNRGFCRGGGRAGRGEKSKRQWC
eukprot:scaffold38787_cov73-Cyclotella_meneghiniana.AAC.5